MLYLLTPVPRQTNHTHFHCFSAIHRIPFTQLYFTGRNKSIIHAPETLTQWQQENNAIFYCYVGYSLFSFIFLFVCIREVESRDIYFTLT